MGFTSDPNDEDDDVAADAVDGDWGLVPQQAPAPASPAGGSVWEGRDWPTIDDPWLADTATAAEGGDETTEVYTKLDAPEFVDPGDEFDVVVGLSAHAPDDAIEPIDVPFQFKFSMYVRTGLEWVVGKPEISFDVDLTQEIPQRTISLRAGDADDEIHVLYFVDGSLVGSALHRVKVGSEAPRDTKRDRGRVHFDRSADLDFVVAVTEHQGTVTVDVYPSGGADPMTKETNLGPSLRDWFDTSIKSIPTATADGTRVMKIRGLGRSIAALLPSGFADQLRTFDGIPRVLVLSQDPYLPWELAYLDDPEGDAAKEVLLGSRAAVGRWPVDVNTSERLPPVEPVEIDELVVLTAEYEVDPLPHAQQEADDLAGQWRVSRIESTTANVLTLLNGKRPWRGLHAALHGRNTPGGRADGLLLADGAVDDDVIRGAEHLGPLVVLNACEVGGGSQELGAWAGLPAAFISRGAQVVVAPLWAINDEVARDAAVAFYDVCNSDGPAEAVRKLRGRFPFTPLDHDTSLTWLAYQYFGHPALQVKLPRSTHP